MQSAIWLKIAGKKWYSGWTIGAVSAYKSRPETKVNEIALKVTLDLPDAIFATPQYEAKISVPEGSTNPVVNADVADNIADILSEQLGISVHVTTQSEDDV